MTSLRSLDPAKLVRLALRRTLRGASAVIRLKLALTIAATAAAALTLLAVIYTITAPLNTAREFADYLRGGAPALPAQRAQCMPDSPAVHGGRYTLEASRSIAEIPHDVTLAKATAFLLYRWTHNEVDSWQPDWQQWDERLNAELITATATDIDIAQSVDPHVDYTPVLVAARATAIDLSISGAVVASKRQIEQVATEIYRNCRTIAETDRLATGLDQEHPA